MKLYELLVWVVIIAITFRIAQGTDAGREDS